MKAQILDVVGKYIAAVKNSGVEVEEAYLFDSYARGTEKEYSDIDVAIVSKELGHDFVEESVRL
jgi:predicted nucleotidyltransferase